MALITPPPNVAVDVQDDRGRISGAAPSWRNFFSAVYMICNALTLSGVTAQRPTRFLWVGRTYFDVTLGLPIWVQSLNPTTWVDAAGNPV